MDCKSMVLYCYTGLEQLLSTVLSHFNLTDIQKFSLPSVTSTGRRQLLHVLSEQDSCLIEGLSYCCDISVQRYNIIIAKHWTIKLLSRAYRASESYLYSLASVGCPSSYSYTMLVVCIR